jgi:hypothetical protein
MSNPFQFSDLSSACQALVQLCQSINHGSIEDLKIERSEPIFDPSPVILWDVKLDTDEVPRAEIDLAEFVLCSEVCRLMRQLHELGTGIIERIDIRAGIPKRIVFRSSLTKATSQSPPESLRQSTSKDLGSIPQPKGDSL